MHKTIFNTKNNAKVQSKYGNIPLYIAIEEGNLEVLQELIKSSVNINLPNNNGATPLYIVSTYSEYLIDDYIVSYQDKRNIAKELIKSGENVDLPDNLIKGIYI